MLNRYLCLWWICDIRAPLASPHKHGGVTFKTRSLEVSVLFGLTPEHIV